jgi:hypothetical protein
LCKTANKKTELAAMESLVEKAKQKMNEQQLRMVSSCLEPFEQEVQRQKEWYWQTIAILRELHTKRTLPRSPLNRGAKRKANDSLHHKASKKAKKQRKKH